jgi:iron complex outermembrane receptor protein
METHMENRHMKRRPLALIGISILAAGTPALAQEDEPEVFDLTAFEVRADQDRGYRVTNAVTATRIGVSIHQTPLSIQVIPEELINDLQIDRFSDVLNYVSGASGDSRGFEGGGNITVRGFRTSWATRNGFRRYNNVSMDNVDRVEIVKGPVSVFYGQAAPGGIINYISKRPIFENSQSLKLEYGSYQYRKGTFEIERVLPFYPKASLRIFGTYEDSEDWRDFEYKRGGYLTPSLTIRPTAWMEIWLEYEYGHVKRNNAYESLRGNRLFFEDYANPPEDVVAYFMEQRRFLTTPEQTIDFLRNRWLHSGFTWSQDVGEVTGDYPFINHEFLPDLTPRGRKFNQSGPDAYWDYESHSATAEIRMQPADWIDIRVAHNYFETDYTELFAPKAYFSGDRTMHHADGGGRLSMNQLHSSQVDLVFNGEMAGVQWKWLVGGEYNRDYYQNLDWDYDYSVLEPVFSRDGTLLERSSVYRFWDPFLHDPIELAKVAVGPAKDSLYEEDPNTREGLYTSLRASLPGERLHFMAGIRRERFSQEMYSKGVLTDSYSVSASTPMGGVLFEFNEVLAAFASYSENYQPNRGVTVRGIGALPEEIDGLPPEFGRGYDLGIKFNHWPSGLSGTLTHFYLERENIARSDRVRNLTDPRNNDISFANNVSWTSVSGLERTSGLELDLLWQPDLHYQLLVAGSWMWEASRVADPALDPEGVEYRRVIEEELRLANAPEYRLSAWNKYRFGEGRLSGFVIGAGFRYSSEVNPRGDEPLISDHVLPGFVVWDALVEYAFTNRDVDYTLKLTIRNLFDKVYAEGMESYADPAKAFLSLKMDF